MNRSNLLVALLLLFHAVVSLQAAPDPYRPYSGTVDEPKWKQIGHDGFSAQIPDSSFKIWSLDEEDMKYFCFAAETDQAWFFALAYDKLKNSPLATLFEFAAAREAAAASVAIDGVKGKLVTFGELGMLHHEVRAFTVQDRTFIFHAIRKKEDRSETDRFFGSIKLDFSKEEIETTPQYLNLLLSGILGESQKNQRDRVDEYQPKQANVPSGNELRMEDRGGQVLASGSGSGSGMAPGNDVPSAADTPVSDMPLTIIESPRPGYTHLARHYNIIGTVILRVTFLADSTVGSVSVSKPLPLGLAENAIRAAKLTRFEPLRRKGTAISVRKPIHYNFIIY